MFSELEKKGPPKWWLPVALVLYLIVLAVATHGDNGSASTPTPPVSLKDCARLEYGYDHHLVCIPKDPKKEKKHAR